VPKIIGELNPIVRERLANIGEDGVLALSVGSVMAHRVGQCWHFPGSHRVAIMSENR
jgi:hypothetical protein